MGNHRIYLKRAKYALICTIFLSFYGLISAAKRPSQVQYSQDKEERRRAPSGAIVVADRPKSRKHDENE
jgi:hypothetical protein